MRAVTIGVAAQRPTGEPVERIVAERLRVAGAVYERRRAAACQWHIVHTNYWLYG